MFDVYLGCVAFGVTLLVASFVLGGHAHGGGGGHHVDHGEIGGSFAPITSLRFWVFLFAIGGAAGIALTELGSSEMVTLGGALAIGWISGAIAVAIIASLRRTSVSSEIGAKELIGSTGTLLLPIAHGKPGKVRLDVKGRQEDFVANVVDEDLSLPTGAAVLIVAEGDAGTLLVAKGEM